MGKQMKIPPLRFPEFKGEWEIKKMSDIAKFSKGKGISKIDVVVDGTTECIRYGELYTRYGEVISQVFSNTNVDIKNLVLSEANDVIIPASGETQIDISTASCIIKSGVALGGDLNIIKTENNGVFLSYYLNNRKKYEIANLAQGVSVVHLYSGQLATLELNLPVIKEQNQIASFLTVIEKKITELKNKKTLLEQYKKGLMQKILSQELRFKNENGKEFPKWEEQKIKGNIDLLSGYAFKGEDISENASGISLLRGVSITEGKLRRSKEIDRYYCGEIAKIKNYILKKGDLVIGMDGSKVGRNSALVDESFDNALLVQRVARIRGTSKGYLPFIYQHINSSTFHRYVDEVKTSSGIPHISSTQINEFTINFPCYQEQVKIANFLSAVDEKIRITEGQLEQSEQYKKGLLQKMFC